MVFSAGRKRRKWRLLLVLPLLVSCASAKPQAKRSAITFPQTSPYEEPAWNNQDAQAEQNRQSGTAGEIRALVETGSPSSLKQALALIQQRNIAGTEFGRVMSSSALTLLDKVYGEKPATPLQIDFPQTNKYTKLIRETESGRYPPPPLSSDDYLELTLPFLAFIDTNTPGRFSVAIPDLEKAMRINPDGALAAYFLGLIFERLPRFNNAAEQYKLALSIAPDCYAAALGLARVLSAQGWQNDAAALLNDLETRHPSNMAIKTQLANIYLKEGMLSKAGKTIQDALAINSRDPDMLLLQARYFIENGQAIQAQFPLDHYIQNNKETAVYLLLRAKVAAEGFNNKNNALDMLRPLLRSYPDTIEIRIYTIKLLLESANENDNTEGKAMLTAMLKAGSSGGNGIPYELIELALQDAVRRSAWEEAKKFRDQIPESRRTSSDLLNSYEIEQGLGNKKGALSYAMELREKYPDNEDGNIAYITALIDSGQKTEAAKIIDERLAYLKAGSFKSRYFYLRSRLQTNQDAVLADLRSALFENPRNLEAIIAMFEIYDKKKDERRAVYYLKQAIALAPANAAVKNYEKKYAGKL